ncbi:hypothetical protein FEM48_Zijuj12G0114400 [Ziziphus jujuba var. spinosa]|uniref:Uncharacterized protein n=1 Tax=Ziziphus jujuba var. spinosa TaxID=714518 RepID=A0A978UD16_ZIZJJ|nr:hypothetical protein FEM48_Zijuj12G0114400 [Ziziphus jujuba var. spinosa]
MPPSSLSMKETLGIHCGIRWKLPSSRCVYLSFPILFLQHQPKCLLPSPPHGNPTHRADLQGFSLYYKSNNSANPLPYFVSSPWFTQRGSLEFVKFQSSPEEGDAFAFELTLEYQAVHSSTGGNVMLARPKYNSTASFLRLGIDGNVKIYTYDDTYTRGNAVKENDCEKKCLGYFYNEQSSRCLMAHELKTLTKVTNSTHVGYIKAPNFHEENNEYNH